MQPCPSGSYRDIPLASSARTLSPFEGGLIFIVGGAASGGMSGSSKTYCLVIVSSRFRMTRVTVVQAASSAGSIFESRFRSPTPSTFRADCESC